MQGRNNKFLAATGISDLVTIGLDPVVDATCGNNRGTFPMREPAPAMRDSWKLRVVDCPRCAAPLVFWRNGAARIDACGFESHRLDCGRCDAALTGVVDPYDEALLVSAARPVARPAAHLPDAALAALACRIDRAD